MDKELEEALGLAARSLGRRDRSRRALAAQLARSGVDGPAAERVLDELTESGYLDDRRLASNRVRALADRHYGDAMIVARLTYEGIATREIDEALADLPAESERALLAVSALRGGPERRSAALRRRGFSEPAIDTALASLDVFDEPSLP